MEVKFGFDQVKKPTPASLGRWVKLYTIVAGTFIGWMQTTPLIKVHAQATWSSILGLSLALVNGISPFFGVQIDEQKVDVQNVTEMEKPK